MWDWWREIKKEPITVSQSNAFGGVLLGILLIIISIILIYSGFISPITHWLKYSK
jgi:membrane protein CcdC involved in cytochrome C biogenesis